MLMMVMVGMLCINDGYGGMLCVNDGYVDEGVCYLWLWWLWCLLLTVDVMIEYATDDYGGDSVY